MVSCLSQIHLDGTGVVKTRTDFPDASSHIHCFYGDVLILNPGLTAFFRILKYKAR